jgi:hypothetical protein
LLNCNKIKNLGVNKEDIVTVLRNSTVLELSSDCERVRRVDNKALPELKLLAKKRKADQDIDEAAIEEVKKLDPYYFNNLALFLRFILIKKLTLSGKKFKMSLRGLIPNSK